MRTSRRRRNRRCARRWPSLPDGDHHFVDHLDDGSPIAVTVRHRRRRGRDRFLRAPARCCAGNLNANRAIVTAAVMYCLRCLIDEDIPLNQGVLAPIEIQLPDVPAQPAATRRPATVCGRGRRQRGDLAAGRRRAARRAGRGRGQPGDDEQPAVRRRDVRLLRDDLRRQRRHARQPTGPTPSTRT